MSNRLFIHSMYIIAKRDFLAHFRSLSNTLILFLYFATGVAFWAATLGGLTVLVSYFQFLLIGLLVLGVYNTSYNYMNVISTEVRRGYTKYLLALPISLGGLTLGRVLTGAFQGIVYVAVLLIFATPLIGFPDATAALTIFATVASLSFCMSSLGVAVATHFNQETMDVASDIIGLFLIYTSTLFYPEHLMPQPLRTISMGNALSAGANLIRAGFGLGETSLRDMLVILAWTSAFGILSIRGYYRRLRELSQ